MYDKSTSSSFFAESPLSPLFCSSAYAAKQPPSTFLSVQFQGLDARGHKSR